jgi:hypothetical protein
MCLLQTSDQCYWPGSATVSLDAKTSLELTKWPSAGRIILASWNFAHIAGARPRGIIQKINYRMQMETPIICTPEELIEKSR